MTWPQPFLNGFEMVFGSLVVMSLTNTPYLQPRECVVTLENSCAAVVRFQERPPTLATLAAEGGRYAFKPRSSPRGRGKFACAAICSAEVFCQLSWPGKNGFGQNINQTAARGKCRWTLRPRGP